MLETISKLATQCERKGQEDTSFRFGLSAGGGSGDGSFIRDGKL